MPGPDAGNIEFGRLEGLGAQITTNCMHPWVISRGTQGAKALLMKYLIILGEGLSPQHDLY